MWQSSWLVKLKPTQSGRRRPADTALRHHCQEREISLAAGESG